MTVGHLRLAESSEAAAARFIALVESLNRLLEIHRAALAAGSELPEHTDRR